MSWSQTILEPLSVALVTDWCPPRVGGIERHVAGLARALAARGHTVHLFTTTPNPAAIPDVTIHPIQAAMIGDVAAPALWRVPELRAMFVDARVDVVHAHGMFSTLAIGGLLAAYGARIPSVTTHHSLLRDSPTLPAAWLTYRLFSWRATAVTAVSQAAADDARRASGRQDVDVLPNGLDRTMWAVRGQTAKVRRPAFVRASDRASFGEVSPERDSQGPRECGKADPTYDRGVPIPNDAVRGVRLQPDQERGGDAGRFRVVSVMRLARKKSPDDLIEAIPLVLASVRRDVLFTIVGDGPEREHLERRARSLGVWANTEFLGNCEPHSVAEVLARSSLFVLPSRREAFGIALLEARAAGLPVVARASGGIPEAIVHGRHGLLTNTRQEFASAIAKLIDDDVLREQFAAASCDGLEAYDWDRVVDRHEAIYRRALDVCR